MSDTAGHAGHVRHTTYKARNPDDHVRRGVRGGAQGVKTAREKARSAAPRRQRDTGVYLRPGVRARNVRQRADGGR